MSEQQWRSTGDHLISNNIEQWNTFLQSLQNALGRTVESIFITPLFGIPKQFCNLQDACEYIVSSKKEIAFTRDSFHSYEIIVTYTNGDRIDMRFKEQQAALASLRRLM